MNRADGYLFAYFGHEKSPDGEQVYFAVSSEEEPMAFAELNNGQPLLRSTVGQGGVRDPFLVRNEVTGGFHLLATDLSLYRSEDWDNAVRCGSRSIVIWDSPDLLTWGAPRLQELSPPSSGCTWAPEAVLDETTGNYLVVWSSTIYGPDDPHRRANPHLRVLCATTQDFRTFGPIDTYLDPGHSVIDTTFLKHQGLIHRFTKDERPRSQEAPNGKHIFQEKTSSSVRFADYQFVAEGIGASVLEHGEGPIAVSSPDAQSSYLLIDEFGGRGYIAFETSDPSSGAWKPVANAQLPPGARHGSLLALSHKERKLLLEHLA
ncbi:glycoside hydrolase family 43 protein [Pseudarthrobacter scleromae]|uniref:glycoside hydrolase family 43 protein n=1 Tax=Pseudarthrobacter scleromae TaxID=158897 RepID=UPI003CFE1AE4